MLIAHVKSIVTRASPRINTLKALDGTNWGSAVTFHVCSSHLVSQHLTIPYSETPIYAKLCPPHSPRWVKMTFIDNLHEENKMVLVKDQFP